MQTELYMAPNQEILEFKKFIMDMNLLDLPLLGWRFTWQNSSNGTVQL